MPLYTFKCNQCGYDEEMLMAVSDISNFYAPCPHCGEQLAKQLDVPAEPVTDNPRWINDHLRAVLQKDGEKPIETRKEHDTYLKNRGIIQRA